MQMNPKIKKLFSVSNVVYGLFFIILIFFTLNVNAKAWLMQGLMKAGFFRSKIELTNHISGKSTNAIPEKLREIYFKDGNGNTFSLSSLKGKVVFINFWATWCPPCRAELPAINKLYEQFKNNSKIVFLMVDVDGKYASSARFMRKHHYNLPVFTAEDEIPPVYLDGAIPTTVIIDKKGAMVVKHTGAANYDTPQVEKALTQLIND